MKLGIFDSGLGGLLIAKSIRAACPDIDIVYLGDTLHLPYGNRSQEAIYEYSRRSVEFLFDQDCALIIAACNTVSASALRQLQKVYLPKSKYSDRRILGVVVPTLEYTLDHGYKNLGVIATNYTINSNIYELELTKLDPSISIHQINAPLLVPLIENEGDQWIPSVLKHYLHPLIRKHVECLILACTHYPFIKQEIRALIGPEISIIAQDEIVPDKLKDYLFRHPEMDQKIDRNGTSYFYVSDITSGYQEASRKIYGYDIDIQCLDFNVEHNCYERKK